MLLLDKIHIDISKNQMDQMTTDRQEVLQQSIPLSRFDPEMS